MTTTRPVKQRSAVPVLIVLTFVYGCCRSLAAGRPGNEVKSETRIDEIALDYDPSGRTIHVQAKGRSLPSQFKGKIATNDGKDDWEGRFEAVDDEAGERRYVSTEYQSQASSPLLRLKLLYKKETLFEDQGKWIADGSSRWRWRSFASELELSLFEIFRDSHQGAVALGGAEFHLTRIPKGKYSIGLTTEQREEPVLVRNNFAGPSSHREGVLDVPLARPFLIATTEVTNAQFHAYVEAEKLPKDAVPPSLRPHRGGRLPPELSELPVAGVSFVAARRYVAWLQDQLAVAAPSWQVRLPHELEWEMAARGTEPRSYAFVDDDAQRGLESLREPQTRPVGTNRLDRSPFGVRDMTGNVREWTNTVYKEQMLLHLAFYIGSGVAEGWDPAHPPSNPELFERLPTGLDKISRGITVRGGANGEPEHLLLLSLRRRLEMTDSEPDVGFRLVWIPREGT